MHLDWIRHVAIEVLLLRFVKEEFNGQENDPISYNKVAIFINVYLSPGLTAGGSDGSFAIALFIMSMNPMERTLLVSLLAALLFGGRNEITAARVTKTRIN